MGCCSKLHGIFYFITYYMIVNWQARYYTALLVRWQQWILRFLVVVQFV